DGPVTESVRDEQPRLAVDLVEREGIPRDGLSLHSRADATDGHTSVPDRLRLPDAGQHYGPHLGRRVDVELVGHPRDGAEAGAAAACGRVPVPQRDLRINDPGTPIDGDDVDRPEASVRGPVHEE